MRLPHVDVPLLLLADAGRLRAALRTGQRRHGVTRTKSSVRHRNTKLKTRGRAFLSSHLAEDGLHSVGVEPQLTLPAQLLVVHLVRMRRTHCQRWSVHPCGTLTGCSQAPTDLTGSRDAPHISTLPPDAALFAVEKAISLLQELQRKDHLCCYCLYRDFTWVWLSFVTSQSVDYLPYILAYI